MTGTSLVDIGVFDAATARRIVGFSGIVNVCLQALSAGFGLHRRATELSRQRRALVLLRNDFELALTHEVSEGERARLYRRYMSTMGEAYEAETVETGPAHREYSREADEADEADRREEGEAVVIVEAERSDKAESYHDTDGETREK
jgi:hypothetical protein